MPPSVNEHTTQPDSIPFLARKRDLDLFTWYREAMRLARSVFPRSFVCSVVGICISLPGCTALEQRFSRRAEKCGALCEQARAARERGLADQADVLLNEAIRQRPNDADTRSQLAETMWEAGRRNKALAEYAMLVQLHPDDPKLQTRLAVLQWIQGDMTSAGKTAETALRLDPNASDALLIKARVDAANGDFDQAIVSYIRLMQQTPQSLEVRLELAEVHIRRGHPDQACPLLRDAMQLPQVTAEHRAIMEWRLGLAYAAAERWGDAAEYLGRAIEQHEASGRDWECLAAVKALSGQEYGGARAMAQLASAHEDTQVSPNIWTELRDRVVHRGPFGGNPESSLTAGTSREGVIRADFNRSAMVIEPRGTGQSN